MTLARKAIRKAVCAFLLNKTDAKERVFTNRSENLWREELPSILIHTRGEPDEKWTEAPTQYERTLEVWVETSVEMVEGAPVDDHLDDIGQQIEDQLLHRLHLPNCPDVDIAKEKSRLVRVDIGVDDEGQALLGAMRHTFQIVYITKVEHVPDEDIDPLTLVHVGFEVVAADAGEDVTDDITIVQPAPIT